MQYSWNRQFLMRDGVPWLPVMGEFHYARYPRSEWRRELLKMKACGVDIAATYVFWIHHEAQEGQFDFSGCRDLRAFVQECHAVGLPVWLRIGPWCHGECRHGGFPDWLMASGIPTRCDDPRYLALVRRLWEAVFQQVKGLMHGDGGPIIGIQIENEFGHCGGEGGSAHMDTLLEMAREIGFVAPYYTATGWGGALIGSMLPVMACYCDAPWDARLAPLPPSPNYLFSHERNDVDVGSDFERGANVSFCEDDYPYLLAEMGGGIGSTFHRRPVAAAADTAAMSLVKLGSGANLLGYYMYHGGLNPGGELNETRESGSWCETAAISYMPHAPIGDGGQVSELAKELKLIAMFLRSYGSQLAPLPALLPEDGATRPDDTIRPRYALRTAQGSGFAFVNQYQRGLPMPDHAYDVPGLGHVQLSGGAYAILPVRMPVGKAFVSSTKASPLCCLNDDTHVFFGQPEYVIEGDPDGQRIITLSRRDALDAWQVQMNGREELIICDAPVLEEHGECFCLTRRDAPWRTLGGTAGCACIPAGKPRITWKRTAVNYLCQDFEVTISYVEEPEEVYLQIAYEGAMAELFADGRKIADDMFDGSLWETALTRFGRPKVLTLRIYALFEGMPCWLEHPPVFEDGRALRLAHISAENEYRIAIHPQQN